MKKKRLWYVNQNYIYDIICDTIVNYRAIRQSANVLEGPDIKNVKQLKPENDQLNL